MAEVIVLGGGLAGLAAAAALGGAGHSVKVLESRPFLGGRATSYEVGNGEEAEFIDNCQHILLRCCVNLLDFYRRLGVERDIAFWREFTFIEPGGRRSVLRSGIFPPPAHFAESFLKLSFLNFNEKLAVARAMQAIPRESKRADLDSISMLDWLKEKRQPARAIERYWRQVLVSAINEELDRMAAAHGLQVFRLGFLARKDAYEMGVPAVPLGRLYGNDAWKRIGNVELRLRTPVSRVAIEDGTVRAVVAGEREMRADFYVCALPFERVDAVAPELGIDVRAFEHSPITGIHLWFDRPITDLPHATLLDRTMQWMFNKHEGRYVQLVVSASRSLTEYAARGCDRAGAPRTRRILSRGARSQARKGARSERNSRDVLSRSPDSKRNVPGTGHISPICFSPATGPNPAGPRRWKAPSAAATSRPKRWRRRPELLRYSSCRISRKKRNGLR